MGCMNKLGRTQVLKNTSKDPRHAILAKSLATQ